MASEARWRAIATAQLVQIASTVLINQANVRYLLLASIICVKLISAPFIIYTSVPAKYRHCRVSCLWRNGADASGDDDLVCLGVGLVLLLLLFIHARSTRWQLPLDRSHLWWFLLSCLPLTAGCLYIYLFLSISSSCLLFWSWIGMQIGFGLILCNALQA